MNDKERLIELLKKDWHAVRWDDYDDFDTVAVIKGEDRRWTRTVEVITKTPSGEFYRWEYEAGLTENQEDYGPCEYGDPELIKVEKREKTVVVTEWVKA